MNLSVLFLIALIGNVKSRDTTKTTQTTKTETTSETTHTSSDPILDDINKIKKLNANAPLTTDEPAEFLKKKDCSSYKPSKRIQCDISLYYANIITQLETINDIKIANKEWEKGLGTGDSFYFIGLDTVNWALAIGHAEMILGTTYASLTMMLPRYHRKQYIHHFVQGDKPTIVYSYDNIEGNDVIDHWGTWTAIEGTSAKNIFYVHNGKAKRGITNENKDKCKNFMDLPKSIGDRKHVSVVIEGSICDRIPEGYRVVVGKYKLIEHKGLHTTKTWVPHWECDLHATER